MIPPLYQKAKKELKSLLMKVKEEWQNWLKTQHSKNENHGSQLHHFKANSGETMETVTDFYFLGSQITADGDCSHEIKRHLLLEREAMTNLESILKSREITLPKNVHLVKAMVFQVVMYGCEFSSVQFSSSVRVRLFVTPWISALQASLSITNSRSLLNPMSIESVMPPNHLILCCPLLLLSSIFPSISVFNNESALHIRWPKYWSFSFSSSPSNECSGLTSFRIDWLNLLVAQGTYALITTPEI